MRPPNAARGLSREAPYLELRNVEAWLGERQVFHNLSIQFQPGENCVILGPNGAGKSSLIKLLCRSIHPVVKPGSWLRIFGSERVNLWDLRARIGMVSDEILGSHRADVCAEDVVLSGFFGSVGLGRHHQPLASQRQRVIALMDQLQLADLRQRRFGELSDGQRRRVLLGRALVHQPEILILDEPTNGLDLRSRYQLLDLLRTLCRQGTTLLMVTHQIEAIIPEIRRCVLMRDGAVMADGSVSDLLKAEPMSTLFSTPLQIFSAAGFHQALPAGNSEQTLAAAEPHKASECCANRYDAS